MNALFAGQTKKNPNFHSKGRSAASAVMFARIVLFWFRGQFRAQEPWLDKELRA